MQTMWDDEHAEYVEKVAKAKYALDMAKKISALKKQETASETGLFFYLQKITKKC